MCKIILTLMQDNLLFYIMYKELKDLLCYQKVSVSSSFC